MSPFFSALSLPAIKRSVVATISRLPYCVGCALLFIHIVFAMVLFFSHSTVADPDIPRPLAERYEELKPELAQSVFGEPIVLHSDTSKHHAQGEVFAVLNIPIADLEDVLSQPKHWCGLAILHINIKACTYRASDQAQQLTFYVGRKYYQSPSQAYPLQYQFRQLENSDTHLYVELTAGEGPFGTHDYSISFEAVPVDAQHSFIYFKYRYHFGLMARMAMNTYLATIGRHKVGFTVNGTDIEGKPAYVGGLQGVVERNAIRYLFAIQALVDARKLPVEDRQQKSLDRWYEQISKHPVQLVEYTREEYLERKKQEIKNQLGLQATR